MKPMYATVTNRGQVTIPVYIRNKLRLSSGNRVEFVAMENSFIAIPINNSIKDLSGILQKPKKPLTLEEMDKIIADSRI